MNESSSKRRLEKGERKEAEAFCKAKQGKAASRPQWLDIYFHFII
jgi:hypothetical protein